MRAPHLFPALLGVLLAAALTGCSVSILDPTEQPSKPPVQEQTSSPDADDAPPATTDDAGLSAEGQAERDRLIAAASTTMPCPDGPLTQDGAIIRIEGPCAVLTIEIDAGVVIADDVDALTLEGSGTIVYVENVEDVTVTGSASSIFWTGATPGVDDTGTSNVLRRG